MSSRLGTDDETKGCHYGRIHAILVTMVMILSGLLPVIPVTGEDAPVQGILDSGINGANKDMTFYLHYVDDAETSKTIIDKSTWYYMDTTQEWSSSTQALRVSAAQQIFKWYVYPVLAHNFTVDSFDLIIWAQRIGGAGHPNKVVKIYEKDKDGETLIHSKNHGAGPGIVAAPTEQTWGSDATWGGHTFKAGNSIVIALELNPGAGNTFDFLFDTALRDSRVVFNSDDSMDITSVCLLDSKGMSRKDLDPTAVNKTVRFRANVTDPFGGYDVKWVNLTLRDPLGGTILANVTMNKVMGNPNTYLNVYEYEWNYTGQPAGTYTVEVWALDNNGYFYRFYDGNPDFGQYYVRFDWDLSIGEITFLNVKVVDSKDMPLVGALVMAVLNDTKIVEGTNVTNVSGMVNLTMFTAEYEVLVFWSDTLVGNLTYQLTADVLEDDPLNITARVYYPAFGLQDGHGIALENASVTLIYPNGTASTPFRSNSSGEFALTQVPGGMYRLNVRWRDVEVNDTVLFIENNTKHSIDASVHYMTVIARDDLGGVLPGAQIVIANNTTAIVFDSKVTNLTGAIMSRLPAGPYDVIIYWQNCMVYERLNISFYSDLTIDAYTGIFVLNITALDGHLLPVPKARILVLTTMESVIESNFTDSGGIVRSRLPRGTHIIRAYWRDVLVNTTQVDLDTNHDVTLALAINYPTIKVLDDEDQPLTNARVDLYYAGTKKMYGSAVTDDDGQLVYKVPATLYDIKVTWLDRLVNETGSVMLDSDDTLIIRASVYSLGIKVEDPHGAPVDNALVELSFDMGVTIGSYTTDTNGTTLVMLPVGTFDIAVYWYGVKVKDIQDLELTAGTVRTIVADVWYINMTPVDSSDQWLDNALVTLSFTDTGRRFGALSTLDLGHAVFRVPDGTYDITVSWNEHTVYSGSGHSFTADADVKLECNVFYLSITIHDSRDKAVEGATISVLYETDLTSVITQNIEDTILLRLPMDIYRVEATWLGVVVNTTANIELDADLELDLDASVFYLDARLVDSRDLPVLDAGISAVLGSNGMSLATGRTDQNGSITLRLPGNAPLNITADWAGVRVLDMMGYTMAADRSETFHASIYYLELELLDSRSVPVQDSNVVLRFQIGKEVYSTGGTDANGSIEFRLPATEYVVEATWWGVRIHQAPLEVTGDSQRTMFVSVSYLTVEVADSRDKALADAWVNLALVSTGTMFGAGLTDANGSLVARLPHESYALTVHWMAVKVASEPTIQLEEDTTKAISAQVYYLEPRLLDDRQMPVEDALVTIRSGTNVSLAMVSSTSSTGEVAFRVPVGEYTLEASWKDVVVAQGFEYIMATDMAPTVNARVFYLTYKAKDSEGAPIKAVRVRIEDAGGNMMGDGDTDKKGRAEFRLPVGTYTVRSRYVTTYMMSPVDITKVSEVGLTSSVEHTERFSGYPIPMHETAGFLVATLSVVLLVVLLLVIFMGLKRRKAAIMDETADLEEYPPEGTDEEEEDGLPSEEEDEAEDEDATSGKEVDE